MCLRTPIRTVAAARQSGTHPTAEWGSESERQRAVSLWRRQEAAPERRRACWSEPAEAVLSLEEELEVEQAQRPAVLREWFQSELVPVLRQAVPANRLASLHPSFRAAWQASVAAVFSKPYSSAQTNSHCTQIPEREPWLRRAWVDVRCVCASLTAEPSPPVRGYHILLSPQLGVERTRKEAGA
jgi:hypothetical protein